MAKTAASVELDGQYRVLREGAGIVIRPGRASIALSGPDAADYLQGQLSNEIESLPAGEGCYAALLDRKGHVQSDMRVLRIAEDEFLLDAEAAGREALARHLSTYKIGRQVEIEDRSSSVALVSVIGPGARSVIGEGPEGEEHAHREFELAMGAPVRAVISDLGIDLICDSGAADAVADRLREAGAVAVSEAAAEILRVEVGRPRFGFEISERTMPAESGIVDRAVDFEKGCYIGQEPVARLHYRGRPNRQLRGLRLSAPAERGESLRLGEREVGVIGTACVSPALGPIALAVIRREAEPGAQVEVGADGASAEVVELPFSS